MKDKTREIVFSDGSKGLSGDWPVAVVYNEYLTNLDGEKVPQLVVDPILDWSVKGNLYGRIMTLVEATTDTNRLKAVKDVFSKELESWYMDVSNSARELANNCNSSNNIYTKH